MISGRSPADLAWAFEETPSQRGRLAVVTGANGGIGYALAEFLGRTGARVVLACRHEQRAELAARSLRAAVPEGQFEVGLLDVADLGSVRDFVSRFTSTEARLDLLVNNAGVYAVPTRRTTVDGFELHLGTNHLGHFALTGLLLPLLAQTSGSRVLSVGSIVHLPARLDFDDLQMEHSYGRQRAYSRSKLANLLFAAELDRRLRRAGLPVVSVAAHPGMTRTNLAVGGSQLGGGTALNRLVDRMSIALNPLNQDVSAGVQPLLYAALSNEAEGGGYYGPSQLFGIRGRPGHSRRSARSLDEASAGRLWECSEVLTGVRYTFR